MSKIYPKQRVVKFLFRRGVKKERNNRAVLNVSLTMGLKFSAESERGEVSSRVEQQDAPSLSLSLARILTMTIMADEDTEETTGRKRTTAKKSWRETLKFTRVASSPLAIPSALARSLEILCNGAGSSLFSKPRRLFFFTIVGRSRVITGTW